MTDDFLFVHVPKRSNYYKPLDDFMFINYIPMGVFALCDRLNQHGVTSRIKHLGLETILDEGFSIVEWVRTHRPKIIGMSLHWHYQAFDVIDVAEKIKRACPEVVIVLGGFTATRFAREILEDFPVVDAVIAGDAERGVVPFAQLVLSGKRDLTSVANCVWRCERGIVENGLSYSASPQDLEELEFANLGLLDHYEQYRDYFRLPMFWANHMSVKENLKNRIGAKTMFPLAIGRGCRVNCTYCGGSERAHERLFNRKCPVLRSPASVVDSMQKALDYGYTGFIAGFDAVPNDDSYGLALMLEIRRRKLTCALGVESWWLPTPAFVDAFQETFELEGSYIAISAESGSEEIRRKNKGIYYSNQDICHLLEYMKAARVPAIVYLALGLPGETRAHFDETAAFAKSLKSRFGNSLAGVFCLPVQMEPTSAIFEEPATYGVRSARSCFMDFYRSHGQSDSDPYSYLGYAVESVSPDIGIFTAIIQAERCKHYCPATPKILGKLELVSVGNFLCKLAHARWKRKQFGAPAKDRMTFR